MHQKLLVLTISLFLALIILPLNQNATADQGITVLLDHLPLPSDTAPMLLQGHTLVPFRVIAEALHVHVAWDNSTRTVTAWNSKTKIQLQINNQTASINQNPVSLETPPVIINNRVLVPLRFFSEVFECQVDWDNNNKTVSINSPAQNMSVIGFYALGDEKTSSWQNLFARPYPEVSTGNTGAVSELALGWYSLDDQGNLTTISKTGWQRPAGWEFVLQQAAAFHLGTAMVVHMTDANSVLTNLLGDPAKRARAIQSIKAEARSYQGVNLDFEGLGYDQGRPSGINNDFTTFVSELSRELKPDGLSLALSLHPLNSVYRGYDYRALGEIADHIIIMAYDYGTTPEPAPMVVQAVTLALDAVPAAKLVLGISLPHETPPSLAAKIGIARRFNLNGIALWRLGLVTEPMWEVIKANTLPDRESGVRSRNGNLFTDAGTDLKPIFHPAGAAVAAGL